MNRENAANQAGAASPSPGGLADSAAPPVVVCDQLSKVYPGGVTALRDFSLTVRRGEIFGFLGPNGAGKTTTIKILLGLQRATAGTVLVLGGDPCLAATRRRIGYLPEVANYYEFLTVVELLSFYGAVCGMPRRRLRERIGDLLDLVGLQDQGRKPLRQFSKGMLQRAGIAQALLHDPDLLVLDEPTTGLDPLARLHMRDVVLAQRAAGKTVFFSSHELSEAEVICDRVGIMREGRLVWCGRTTEVAGDGSENLERKFIKLIGAKED